MLGNRDWFKGKTDEPANESTMACSTAAWKWLLVDVLLGATVIVFIAISQFQLIVPKKSGFFCNDQSIKLPFTGDTVPVSLLLIINLGIPLLAAILIEKFRNNGSNCVLAPANGLKPCLKNIGKVLLDFLLGKFFVLFLAEVLKNVTAEHRPHFLVTCKPNVTHCSNEFVTNYMCTNSESSKSAINDAFKSFPSSHAISAFYSSVFIMLYVHIRGRSLVSRLVCPWLYLMLLSWSLYCSASRVSDHRHHWWDVVAGGFIGTIFAVATVGTLSNWFCQTNSTAITTPIEDPQPEKRISTRRLIGSSSSDNKDGGAGNKTLESNHL